MSAAIYEPDPEATSRTRLHPWIIAGVLLLLVALLAFCVATMPFWLHKGVWQYKEPLVLRVLTSDGALQLGAIDPGKDIAGEVDRSIAHLEVLVERVRWEVDEYGFPLCHIEPRQASVSSVSHFLSSHADRSAVVDVEGRAVHVIHLTESLPERLVLRFGYPWRSSDEQPFDDMKALREHLLVRIR